MTIRLKTTLITITAVIAGVLIFYAAASRILGSGFSRLEQSYVQENIKRAQNALERELEGVAVATADWGHWTELWLYVRGETPGWYDHNAGLSTLTALNLNLLGVFDTSGKLLNGGGLDLSSFEEMPFPQELVHYLQEESGLLEHQQPDKVQKTMINLSGQTLLIASAPIVQSDYSGDIAGSVVFARYLDQSFIDRLQEQTQLELTFSALDELTDNEAHAYQELSRGQALVFHIHSETLMGGHVLLKDEQGQPTLLLNVEMPRPIHMQALASGRQLLLLALLAAFIFALAFNMLAHFGLVRGFQRLNKSVQKVTQARDATLRIETRGQDEFAQLGQSINGMLATLEQSQNKLRESEKRYALAVTGVNDGLWEWDIENDEMFFSARWMQMLGYEAKEHRAGSRFWPEHMHPDDLPRVLPELVRHLKGDTQFYEGEYRMRHQSGSYHWVLVRGVSERDPLTQRTVRMAGSLTDITKRGVFDALTGLPNRQLMQEHLKHAHSYSQRHSETPAAVLFIDLNRFKEINDSLGHAVGDQLLLEFAKRLQGIVRGEDKIARFGGDEFVVLMEGLDEKSVIAVAERLSHETSKVYDIGGQQVFSSSSIGIVTNLQRYDNTSDILRDADIAMYRSKSQKLPYVVFTDEMFKQVSEKQKLETDLRQALNKKEFFLVYQPVVELGSKQIVGFEALIRWQRGDKLVPPLDFIPLAEETGLIVPIGTWVLEEATKQLKAWQQNLGKSDLYMTVNLSSRQLSQPNLVSMVAELLERTQLSANTLHLEITESVVIDNQQAAVTTLQTLRHMGIRILMDDFGTGYSSLTYLTNLPIDRLKLDRSFASQLEKDSKIFEVVRTIITLAQTVNMSVIAEGIETSSQADKLAELQCDFGQGYLFAKPQKPEAIEALLQQELSVIPVPATPAATVGA
jgi:diguanylate cyclase (GGDEF)-like protein/PAS domain S-box-containing protein